MEATTILTRGASKKAVVTVSIVGLRTKGSTPKLVFDGDTAKTASYIGPYLVPDQAAIASPSARPLSSLGEMTNGSMPNDGGGLILMPDEARELMRREPSATTFLKKLLGSEDTIHGKFRYCLWIPTDRVDDALTLEPVRTRVEAVKRHRISSDRHTTNELAATPHRFGEVRHPGSQSMVVPRHSAEERPFLPFELIDGHTVVGDSAFMLPDYKLHEVAIYGSRLHYIWVRTVCGQLETRIRYSNTLGWNTFPVPMLTEQNKADLTACAEAILLAREAHFPATIADLYDPDAMPDNLRHAHERNDEVLERIYVGRRFKNDTERLEKLFELYTKMTAAAAAAKSAAKARRARQTS
jgi:hypothetical protein